jgi:hypothetical protein
LGAPLGGMKFDPFTVNVNAAPFGLTLVGLTLEISGVATVTGLMMMVAAVWLKPPPGGGFEMVICAIPGLATSDASTAMATWFVLTFTTALRGDPFQKAVDTPAELLFINPVPETKRVNPWPPAVTLSGARLVRTGVGLNVTLAELELHPEMSVARIASIPNVVHRRCINPFLHSFSANHR